MHSAYDLVMCLGSFDEHMGGLHRGYSVDQRNVEG